MNLLQKNLSELTIEDKLNILLVYDMCWLKYRLAQNEFSFAHSVLTGCGYSHMVNYRTDIVDEAVIEERFEEISDGFDAVDVAELFEIYAKTGMDLLEVYNSYNDFIALP